MPEGNMTRHKAREQAFALIFESSINKSTVTENIAGDEGVYDGGIDAFAQKTACGVEANEEALDGMIKKYIRGWSFARLSKVTLSVLRLALYEMMFEKDIPVSVSINEAVLIAGKYGGAEDAPFVNGVLGSAAKEIGEKDA
ncbi:MAG TPA: transcription antitermination factor NusB [Ruminococcaceae bacterium]|nr:transcription antitermination factor NusB [Oscillospiraceae bacterium]